HRRVTAPSGAVVMARSSRNLIWRVVVGASMVAVIGLGVKGFLSDDRSGSARRTPSGSVDAAVAESRSHESPPWETEDVYEAFAHLVPAHEGNWLLYGELAFMPLDDATRTPDAVRAGWSEAAQFIPQARSGNGRPSKQVQAGFA